MRTILCIALLSLTPACALAAQRAGTGDVPTIAEKTAGMQKFEGFFNLYWEEKAEKMWMEISKPGTEFLYVTDYASSIEGRNRGSWSGGQVMRFDRYGAKVFLTQVNYQNRAGCGAARRADRERRHINALADLGSQKPLSTGIH